MNLVNLEEQTRKLRQKDNGAIENLVHDNTQALLAASLGMGFSESDAQELVQQTFVAFLSAIDRFEGRSKLKTFLFGILYNKAREMWRQRSREEELDESDLVFEKRFDVRGMWAKPPQGPED